MLPSKSHLQLIVKELEKFESDLEKSYNFQEFIDRCRVIFKPEVQEDLDYQIYLFEEKNMIDTLNAQSILYKVRVEGKAGRYVIHLKYDDKPSEKIPLNMNNLEYGLRRIVIWCRKQIIKMIKDEQIQFDKITTLDLEGASQ